MAGRVKRPIALSRSDAFHSACTPAIADPDSWGTCAASNNQTGIQNTDENRPHAEKSCCHCQRKSEPKNSRRHVPSVEAGAGANQNLSQRRIRPRIMAALPR